MTEPLFIVSREDWSLHRKGYQDQDDPREPAPQRGPWAFLGLFLFLGCIHPPTKNPSCQQSVFDVFVK